LRCGVCVQSLVHNYHIVRESVVHGTWSGACPFTRRFSRLAATVSGPENGRTFARILEPCARASGHDNMDLHCSLISNDSDVELLDCLRRGEEAWAFLTVHEGYIGMLGPLRRVVCCVTWDYVRRVYRKPQLLLSRALFGWSLMRCYLEFLSKRNGNKLFLH
jgi:hypothetical protein